MTSPTDGPHEGRIDPQDEHTPIEHDPTGMRALLSSLPDPGPMPPDVEQRLWAALSHEREARARGELNPVPLAAAPVHDMQAHREQRTQAQQRTQAARRPRRHHGLLVAAAVAGIAAAGGVGVFTAMGGPNAVLTALNGQDDVAGAAPEQEEAPDAAIPRAESPNDEATRATGAPNSAAPAPSATSAGATKLDPFEVRVVSSDEAYTTADLASQAGETASRATILLPTQGTGPLTTPAQIRACTGSLGIPARDGVLVDLAEVDGKPAAVVIRQLPSGQMTAYAVSRTCSSSDPGRLSGPVDLP